MPLTGFPSVDTRCSEKLQKLAPDLVVLLRLRGRVTSPVIEADLGISGVQVRALVSWMRCQGRRDISRIGSDGNGYWWATTREDIRPTIEHVEQRARKLYQVRDGMIRAFDDENGQGVLI